VTWFYLVQEGKIYTPEKMQKAWEQKGRQMKERYCHPLTGWKNHLKGGHRKKKRNWAWKEQGGDEAKTGGHHVSYSRACGRGKVKTERNKPTLVESELEGEWFSTLRIKKKNFKRRERTCPACSLPGGGVLCLTEFHEGGEGSPFFRGGGG